MPKGAENRFLEADASLLYSTGENEAPTWLLTLKR